MYENKDTRLEPKQATLEILWQMLTGAAATAGVLLAAGLFMYAIYLISLILPPESKEADDPTPDSFSMVIDAEETRLG